MFTRHPARFLLVMLVWVALGCGSSSESPEATTAPAPTASATAEPAGESLDRGIVLALAQFVTEGGKPKPGAARLEFLTLRDGTWGMTYIEDPDSNVFHKAMAYDRGQGAELLTLGGTGAHVKTWRKSGGKLEGDSHWTRDFGGKWSRMRDAEVADLYGDGSAAIAVATHDQGVVAVLRPNGDGFEIIELDEEADTFVHEIEIGDVDADGVLEVYATPSEPNKLDGMPQRGQVVRYIPAKGEGRQVVADLGDRHAKEILVDDVDGDGVDELYVSVEGHLGGGDGKTLEDPVEIRRYDADTPPDQGVVVGTLQDRLTRFLTAGDVDGDGKKELVAAAFSSGVWLFRPGGQGPGASWTSELVDADSAGFEHAAILTDLDADGVDELYVASDRHKQVRRYVWRDGKPVREIIYRRPDNRPIFTWNLMPLPLELTPNS
ncbi:VCBS repeat-containing protein [Myxococcota bacterium]|nr:VCBS repeat-containing protein [Myxococcota bacterium]